MSGAQQHMTATELFRRVGIYATSSARVAVRHPAAFRPRALARHFRTWWASLDAPSPVEGVPWLCYEAIDVLERWLRPEMRVFEWGSGGSTVFLAERAREVRSIEHDRAWHDVVRSRLEQRGLERVRLQLIEPEQVAAPPGAPSDPYANASGDARYPTYSFASYVNAIADVPDRSLDLVLVDGRARPSCCRAAMPKVRVGGLLVLDNAEVEYYEPVRRLFEPRRWALTDVWGPLPGMRHFSETCIWTRIEA